MQYPGMGHIMGASFLPECHDMFADVKSRFGRGAARSDSELPPHGSSLRGELDVSIAHGPLQS